MVAAWRSTRTTSMLLRRARCTLPRRRSGRLRAHLDGRGEGPRREQPTRTPRATADSVNVDHRRGERLAVGETIAYIHATCDLAPTSMGTSKSSTGWDNLGVVITAVLTGPRRGLRFRMARDRPFRVRRRPALPLRTLRRGRPRRRARPLRGTTPAAPRLENAASQWASTAGPASRPEMGRDGGAD